MNERILVVEDEPVVAMDLRQRLVDRGYEVVGVVASADAAVSTVSEQSPDLVLMDVMLHGEGDGIEAASRIRRESDVPIVYLTAYADDATIERAKTTDASGYVVKPFRDRELHATLQVALSRRGEARTTEQLLRRLGKLMSELRGSEIVVDLDGTLTFGAVGQGASREEEIGALKSLTPRERAVVAQLLSGLPIDDAASVLGISRHTVRNHLKAIYRKLGVHSQVELVRRYRQTDLESN